MLTALEINVKVVVVGDVVVLTMTGDNRTESSEPLKPPYLFEIYVIIISYNRFSRLTMRKKRKKNQE